MTVLHEKLRKDPLPNVLWHGVVASGATDLSDRIEVVVPDFDPDVRWENCRWQARDDTSLPARGDVCVVILTNRGEPWVIAWSPFS